MDPKNLPICFFCMEYAVDNDSHSYAGGLGILAGDYLLEAADLNIPVIAIGLHYGKDISKDFILLDQIEVPMQGENLKVIVWQRNFGKSVTLLLLESQGITDTLYDSDFYKRMKQELLLGIGGVRILKKYKL